MSSGKPFVERHDRAVVLLDLLFAQSQVGHKGHIEVPLNHPRVKLSEMPMQAKKDNWAERCRRGEPSQSGGRLTWAILRVERLARALNRETRFGARERNGQKRLRLHKQGREAAAVTENKSFVAAASYDQGRHQPAGAGQ